MPTLTILVTDPPTEYGDYRDLKLKLAAGKALIDPSSEGAYIVDYAIKNDQPTGPSVVRGNDGRRFIYLQWLGVKEGQVQPYGRIKLFFEDIPAGAESVTLPGKNQRGQPSCARTRPIA